MKKLMPSSKHYVVYDAVTYEQNGFIKRAGNVARLSQTPQFWCVAVICRTQDKDGGDIQEDKFTFKTKGKCRLSDVAGLINCKILKEDTGYKEVCLSVMVTARIMMATGG